MSLFFPIPGSRTSVPAFLRSTVHGPRSTLFFVFLFVAPVAADDQSPRSGPNDNWPQWRGPLGTGVSPHANPPTKWSEKSNVRWKTKLPGLGHSTPIVWNDRVFVTAAVPYGKPLAPIPSSAPGTHDNLPVTHRQRFVAIALDRATGQILWQRTLHKALPHEQGHHTASLASNSPVTDGKTIFTFFGSHGLYALDFDGKPLWERDFGRLDSLHGHGDGSSPALYGKLLVVNCDHEGGSFATALDKYTGEPRWRVDRDEVTSWATPIVVKHDGKPQVIIAGTNRVRGYDLATGKVIWECGGLSANIVASPVAADGMVYAGSSYDKRALLAIRLAGASGDVTGSDQVVWNRFQGTPYVPSPLLYDKSLYFLTHYQGILTRIDAQSGEDRPGPFRLGGIGDVYSSPVGAAGRIYVTGREGTTLVISHSDDPQVLARNMLDDTFSSSAAIAGNELFLRGERFLYCLSSYATTLMP